MKGVMGWGGRCGGGGGGRRGREGERELRGVVMKENEGRLVKGVVWVREMGGGGGRVVVGGSGGRRGKCSGGWGGG